MKRRLLHSGIVSILLVVILAGCGGGSTPDSTATTVGVTPTNAVEPTGEPAETVVIPTNPPEDDVEPWSPYAAGEPTPTVLPGGQCSYGDDAKPVHLTYEELRAEFHACNDAFAWPEGYEIDIVRFVSMWDSPGGRAGIARGTIMFNNACAWTTYWVDATREGDQESADAALQSMFSIYPSWTTIDPASGETDDVPAYFRDMLDTLELGDPGPVVQFVNSENCAFYKTMRVNP